VGWGSCVSWCWGAVEPGFLAVVLTWPPPATDDFLDCERPRSECHGTPSVVN
jgi:hypothetical protein